MNTLKQLTPQDFIAIEEGVLKFNKVMGNNLETGEGKYVSLYENLSNEEYFGKGEYLDSSEKGDKVGTLDGLIDLAFVVFAWYKSHKPSNCLEMEYSWLKDVCNESAINKQSMSESLGRAIKGGDSQGAQTYLIELLISVQDKFDIVGAFNEVLRSNLSKASVKGEISKEEEIQRILDAGRYSDITVDEILVSDEIYLVFKAGKDLESGVQFATPKLIKCSTFSEPELGQWVY